MKTKLLLLPLLLAPALASCSSSDSFDAHVNGNLHIAFDNGALVVTSPGRPDARVAANGDFRIGDNAVALTPAQRGLLKQFYGEAIGVRDDGIATGKAGAALGVHAVGAALDGIFSGDSHKVDHEMDARSKVVETAAMHLCGDLQHLKTTQATLGTQLPVFKPYAVFRGEIECDRHSHENLGDADRDHIRDEIRDSIRDTVRTTARQATRDPAVATTSASAMR